MPRRPESVFPPAESFEVPAALHSRKNPKDRNSDPHSDDAPDGAAQNGSEDGGSLRDAPSSGDADALRQQLQAKEQLVHALTERLEQAAEQLDRLRRTGADKGRRAVGGGLPPELVEQHRTTIDDLKRVIERWEDIQAGATLGRIETQIIELRSLVAGAVQSGGTFSAAATPARDAAAGAAAKPAGGSWWEAQKAAMLGDGPPPPALDSPPQRHEADDDSDRQPREADPESLDIPELPDAVDFEGLTLEDARQAIRQRDDLIQRLREPLLLMHTSGQLPDGLQSLEQAPEPLRARLEEVEKQWQAKFRQAELDLSLERARLAREQSAVKQQQELIQKEMRRLGLNGDKPGETSQNKDDPSKRRWFRFMNKAGEADAQADHTDED
jgi:hypothetical protein